MIFMDSIFEEFTNSKIAEENRTISFVRSDDHYGTDYVSN